MPPEKLQLFVQISLDEEKQTGEMWCDAGTDDPFEARMETTHESGSKLFPSSDPWQFFLKI